MGLLGLLSLAPGWLGGTATADDSGDAEAIRAARAGDAAAQLELGERYDLGRGVPQDFTEAVRWYRLSAEQGNARAQFALAEMYKNGDGVARSLPEALRWYRRSADQGHAGAQLLLGVLYESGTGVAEDFAEAARWYRRSAAGGDARAQLLLGNLYNLGQGVPKSAVIAYALYTVSSAGEPRGNPASGHRTALAASMSAAEIEAAESLALELAKPGNLSAALDRFAASRP